MLSNASVETGHQLVQGDGQIANTNTRCVIDCVCNGCANPCYTGFTDAASAHRRLRVGLVGVEDFNRRYVHLHRHMIIRQGGVHDASSPLIEIGLFGQGKPDAHYDAAFELAGRHFGIEDLPGVEGTQEAGDARLAGECADAHLAELRAIGVH